MSAERPVLIVGAGLAGLSAAYHLGNRPYRLIEREEHVGGLCRSVRERGFTFDYTGHLLHMRRPEIRRLVSSLVADSSFLRIDRLAAVYSHGSYTAYPFQVNTHGLPASVVRECVMGFLETLQSPPSVGSEPSFHEWVMATFGTGIARHFMIPYNEKLFCTDLRSVSADWVSWSIPKPSWPDVLRGALGRNEKAFGYNPQFLYPADGGIDTLPRAFLPRVRAPELGISVVGIDPSRREARLSSGERVAYASMITTMPLPALLEICDPAPAELRTAARRLRHVSVLNLNLGFDRPCLQPHHWVYFADPELPFYRVGVYSNLCPASVPAGHSSYYVEIAHRPDEPPCVEELVPRCVELLRRIGLVPATATHVCTRPVEIAVGYVIHDRARAELLPRIHGFLREQSIDSVGRYGAWEYSAMEDALWQGRAAAERILRES